MTRQPRPCGTWPSPVTPSLACGKTVTLSGVSTSGDRVLWLERRPSEKGRTVLVLWQDGTEPRDLTPADVDVATKVHEYGGGAYAVQDNAIVFSNRIDGSVHLLDLEGAPQRRLAGGAALRYASFAFAPDGRTIFAVREDHRPDGEPVNTLVALGLAPPSETIIAAGADFYSTPTPSPDGTRLAWIEWDHPAMPWTSTRLCVMDLADPSSRRVLGGTARQESLTEPHWADPHSLLAISDRSGWCNLWRFDLTNGECAPVCPMDAEIGQPHWVFGQRSYALLPDGRVLALAVRNGQTQTILLAPNSDGYNVSPLALGLPEQCPCPFGEQFAWLDAPADAAPRVVVGTPGTPPRVLRAATTLPFGRDDIALPESIPFPLADGTPGHAFFYAPANSRYSMPYGELPPMIVTAHGGPTARAHEGFSFKVQWWTSRGFAVLDVNYSGSTGFGRSYRERLDGQWGVRDVEDCIAATTSMATSGRVDPQRIAIRGSSAGGLTVLSALASSDIFAAGVSLYGVTDLRTLAEETHKFEARYLDSLVGPWPDAEAVYRARSPLFMADRIHAPVLFLQGLDDTVVPPAQARSMVTALRKNGVTCPLVEFPGEGHGFRGEETLQRAFQIELAFYGRVFGFVPADVTLSDADTTLLNEVVATRQPS
ncbi:S9 family peptidase [Acetobacter conturbans]|uniref:Prolyl oligopeptidase family serine peptidase n=1 Tax=Acetobacter conturbans TaxID=1737472 RepID=A0ABX0K117_9PROT|nr:S9 family peptidase [Acetobacter conturbans]NHN88393.1 prolyl oligopeptidase family serine peptidase [Acetobacter conturbans]